MLMRNRHAINDLLTRLANKKLNKRLPIGDALRKQACSISRHNFMFVFMSGSHLFGLRMVA